MAPKQKQNMASVTHNASESNKSGKSSGILSKFKRNSSSASVTAQSVKSQPAISSSAMHNNMNYGSGHSHSGHGGLVRPSGNSQHRQQRGNSSSFTQGERDGGIPTVLAIPPDISIGQQPSSSSQQSQKSGRATRRSSFVESSNTASRALANLSVGPSGPQSVGPGPGPGPGGMGGQIGRGSGGGGGGSRRSSMDNSVGSRKSSMDHSVGGGSYRMEDGSYGYDHAGGGIFDDGYMTGAGVRNMNTSPDRNQHRRASTDMGSYGSTKHRSHREPKRNSMDNSSVHSERSSGSRRRSVDNMGRPQQNGASDYSNYSAPQRQQQSQHQQQQYQGQQYQNQYQQEQFYETYDQDYQSQHHQNQYQNQYQQDQYQNQYQQDQYQNQYQQNYLQSYDRNYNQDNRSCFSTPAPNTKAPEELLRRSTNTEITESTGHTQDPHYANSNLGPYQQRGSGGNVGWDGNVNGHVSERRSSQSTRMPREEDERTMATNTTKKQALRPATIGKAKDMSVPQGEVTIVYTDVQESTSLWEKCPSAMKKALDVHDTIIRQCYTDHSGYEITTEGDAFNLAFQHPVDALAFALQAQLKLYKANWPEEILHHPDAKDEPALKFKGFRVRFGLHHGPTTSRIHETTGRTVYIGDGVKIAKAVEKLCHGGQILTTVETWKAVSGMAERALGRPQIVDCGEHLLYETKTPTIGASGYTTTRCSKRIMQVVPSELAFDFFEARGRRDILPEGNPSGSPVGFEIKDASLVNGRLFPPLKSKRQLTTSFLNAPYANGRVTICFVYTVGLDDSNPQNRVPNLTTLAKYLRKQLLFLNPPGYECQEDDGHWMLAFDRMAHAVTFGLQLKAAVDSVDLIGNVDRERMFKVGIVSGPFTSMGPHKTTGRADYFGPIVNRAARVCSNSEPGEVCIGIPLSNGESAVAPDFGPEVKVEQVGIKKLKGITIDVAIFSCKKRRIERLYP